MNSKYLELNPINIQSKIVFLFCLFLLTTTPGFSSENFILKEKSLHTISSKHLQFLEGYNEFIDIDDLENGNWQSKLKNAQSIYNGYWVRIAIKNELPIENIGLYHNENREKKVFVVNSFGVRESNYWKWSINPLIGDDYFFDHLKIRMPINETTVVYDFFRSQPFDRHMGIENGLDRMMIGSWQKLRENVLISLIGPFAFFTPALMLGLYFLFMFFVARGNYIWVALSLFQICAFIFFSMISKSIGFNSVFANEKGVPVFFGGLFLFLTIFFQKSLRINVKYPKFNYLFNFGIIFYIFSIIINLIYSLNWPNQENFDLISFPPDRRGNGIIKIREIFIPFIFLLFSSIVISFLSWREGRSASGYLLLSFLLPFLSIPVAVIAYLFFEGPNWYFWAFTAPTAGFLFLSMFVSFGFSVAAEVNELKQVNFENQVQLNNELEAKVKERTAELVQANNLITDSIQSASAIQSAILPNIEPNNYGFSELVYIWEPRDIVGGDFYWVQKQDNWTALVVADCTGHGIPGAFMTLISTTILNRIASLHDLSNPGHILDKLDELLSQTFKLSTGDSTNFGLDCGVCCFSKKDGILRFAGAKSNLYQKVGKEVKEMKGNKVSLGYDLKEHPIPFKVVETQLDKKSSFYMFSDGITDQVGGEKKLMYGKKRLLQQIRSSATVNTAIEGIMTDLTGYQSNHKRRDDLTLFGFSF